PRAPAAWEEYTIDYRFGGTTYAITVRREPGLASVTTTVDGAQTPDAGIPLRDDGKAHTALVLRPA
ncbi:MAG: hypothetical protein ACM357_07140, partial [Gemmatimonadota bacterium]